MKLHLPLSLRRFVYLASLVLLTATTNNAMAATNQTRNGIEYRPYGDYSLLGIHESFYSVSKIKADGIYFTVCTATSVNKYAQTCVNYPNRYEDNQMTEEDIASLKEQTKEGGSLYGVAMVVGNGTSLKDANGNVKAQGYAQIDGHVWAQGDVIIHSDSWMMIIDNKSMDATGHTLVIGTEGTSLELITKPVKNATRTIPTYGGVLNFYSLGNYEVDSEKNGPIRTLTVGELETHMGAYVNDLQTFIVKEGDNVDSSHYATSDKDMDVRHNGVNKEGVDNGYILTDISGNDVTIVKGDFSLLSNATPYTFGQERDENGNLVDIVKDQDGNVITPENMDYDLMNTGDYGYVKSLTIGFGIDGVIEAGTSTVKALNALQVINGITIGTGSELNMNGFALETNSIKGSVTNVSSFMVADFDDTSAYTADYESSSGTKDPARGFTADITNVHALAYVQKGDEAGMMNVEKSADTNAYTLRGIDANESLTVEKGNFILNLSEVSEMVIGKTEEKTEEDAENNPETIAEPPTVVATVTATQDITVDSLTCHANAKLEMDGYDLVFASELINNGCMEGDITVQSGARAAGSGTYSGLVTVEGGGHLHIGNSPGYSSFKNGLTLKNGASISFSVDGVTPASGANATGCHSYTEVTGGVLTLNSGETAIVEVDIMGGIIAAGYKPFTLTLLQVVDPASAAVNGGFTLSLTGETDLLLDALTKLEWDATTGSLIFRGMVNPGNAAERSGVNGVAVVNTLWSSTSMLRAFARHATSQLAAPVTGQHGLSVWAGALSDYTTMSGYRSNAHGAAVGADKQWTRNLRAGLSVGTMYGDYTADQGIAEVDQESVMLSLYGQYEKELNKRHSLSFTGYAAYGNVENEADTRVLGIAELPGQASWDEDVYAVGLRAEWNIRVTSKTSISPFIGLEYLHGAQSDFSETYIAGTIDYSHGSMQVWSIPAGVTFRTECDFRNGQKLLPWLTLGYVGDISRKNPHTHSRMFEQEQCVEGANPGRHGFMLNTGANWQISDSWSAGASYNLETRSHETSHEGNISVRYAF